MITFWGHFSGGGSYPVVCKAIAEVLADEFEQELRIGNLRGETFTALPSIRRVPDSELFDVRCRAQYGAEYSGPMHDGIGLMFGFPTWLANLPTYAEVVGYHVCDLDRIPESWVDAMNRFTTHVVTPSKWCANIFEKCGVANKARVVPHGVPEHDYSGASITTGPFYFDHFCSSQVPDRKGTLELINGFLKVLDRMPGAVLRIRTASPIVLDRVASIGSDRIIALPEEFRPVQVQMERYRSTNVLVQPSRAEGFGLLPLEALSVGVPAVATTCTGHAEWFPTLGGGIAKVRHGKLAPCPPGPGLAPSVAADDISDALLYAFMEYDTLRAEAVARRSNVREVWAWRRVLKPLVDLLRRLGS